MHGLTGVFISPHVFHFTSRFSSHVSSRFRYQHVGIQNASENARKMQEKREKNPNASPTRDNVSILRYALGKNASQSGFACVLLEFCVRFACILLAFCSCFARVLLVFCSCFAHKLYQNGNPTQCVIWP